MYDLPLIPIAKVQIDKEESLAVNQVVESGNLRQGKLTEAFEKAFAKMVGAKHAIAVSSGTAALHVAYLAAVPEGSEILVPSFSHISTASMVFFANSRPVICDLDPKSFLIDLVDAAKRITAKTKAIAPVHLFGNSCNVDAVNQFAIKHGLKVVWDAAQAHGSMYKNKDVGCFGDLVTYSFYPTKNITTGEGGMITTNDDALAKHCRLLRSHGQEKKYYHTLLGLHYRMTEMQAAIGLEQLKKLGNFIAIRRKNAEQLTELLRNVPGIRCQSITENSVHSYHQYTILLDEKRLGLTRNEFARILQEEFQIQTAIHYPRAIHQQPIIIEKLGRQALPTAEYLTNHVLSLPIHPALTNDDLNRVAHAITKTAQKYAPRPTFEV